MSNSLPPDLQRSIQRSLQDIALQIGWPLDEAAAEQIYQETDYLLSHIPCEPLTFARVAGTLLVYQIQNIESEELEWFKAQLQQCSLPEDIEELIESMSRVDSL